MHTFSLGASLFTLLNGSASSTLEFELTFELEVVVVVVVVVAGFETEFEVSR